MYWKGTFVVVGLLTAISLTYSESCGWRADINGTRVRLDASDAASAVTVDGAGDFIAAGYTGNTAGPDFTVIKFSGATGDELWGQFIRNEVGQYASAKAVAVDRSGDVVAAGETDRFYYPAVRGSTFTVAKFDGATGTELWRRLIHGTASNDFFDVANAVAIDAEGNVIAAGVTVNTGTLADFTVAKLSGSTGAEIWRRTLNGTANSDDAALTVTVDSVGHVIAGGYLRNLGTDGGFTVVKFHGQSGAELWRQVINGPANALDSVATVTVDGGDNVIAGGSLWPTHDHGDFTVMKFDGTSGSERWRWTIPGTASGYQSAASAVTVDQAGNAIAVGVAENAGAPGNFTVVKLEGLSGAELWRQTLRGTANGVGVASAAMLDAEGNVIAAGYLRNAGAGPDFTLVKFDGSNGAEQWRRTIKGSADRDDFASAIAVDVAGNAVAVGVTWNLVTERDFAVVKAAAGTGDELWRREINGTIVTANDQGNAIALDGTGDIIAAGSTQNDDSFGDFTVVKVEGAGGTEVWRQVTRGTAGSGNGATAVTADPAGDLIAAGLLTNASTGADFTVIKYDGREGSELWRQVINGTLNNTDAAYAVVVDGAGDVIAAGVVLNDLSLNSGFTVIKFDGVTGAELWRQTLGGPDTRGGVALAVALDTEGNVVAAGSTTHFAGAARDFTVAKFEGESGRELWRHLVVSTAPLPIGEARAVAVDGSGNVVAAGTTRNSNPFDEFTVVKVDGMSGAEQWRRTIRGTANYNAEANAVAVDPAGDVVAVGTTLNVGTYNDFTVIKFEGISGNELWRQTVSGGGDGSNDDRGRAVALDAAGSVVAAGVLNYPSGFAVIKFDGTTGVELWRRRIQGSSRFWDEARAVLVDSAGDVIGGGQVRNRYTLDDLAVVKLSGLDGAEF